MLKFKRAEYYEKKANSGVEDFDFTVDSVMIIGFSSCNLTPQGCVPKLYKDVDRAINIPFLIRYITRLVTARDWLRMPNVAPPSTCAEVALATSDFYYNYSSFVL